MLLGLSLSLAGGGGGIQRSGATVDFNFPLGIYGMGNAYVSNPANLPGWSFSRASTGTAVDSQGNIISFGSGVPRITDLGLLIEESRTNSFLNSAVGVTQAVTTTAASWTLSFYGTGSITLTGGATGTLAGTGANNRVTLTVTATAASTTLTVTGSTTNVQFEAGAFASSYIPTTGATATRAADVASVNPITAPAGGYTLFAQYLIPTAAVGYRNLLEVGDGTANNRTDIGNQDVSSFHTVAVGGVTVAGFGSTFSTPVNTVVKSALAVTPGRQMPSVGGQLTTAQTGASINSGSLQLFIGTDAFARRANGYIKQISLYPTVYSDAQLQALTT